MIGCIALLSALLTFTAWLSTPLVPQFIGTSFRCVNTQEKVVALTFDDGPNPDGTQEMLDLLEKHNIHATFFLIGKKVKLSPELARKIWHAGHQVGNHSWSHTLMMFKSPRYMRQEVEKTDKLLRKLGYSKEILFQGSFRYEITLVTYGPKNLKKEKHFI